MAPSPCPQAIGTPFSPPPLENENLTLPAIYEFHRQQNPAHSLFCWPTDDGIKTLSFSEATQGFDNVAKLVLETVGDPDHSPIVVAILVVVDQVSYFALISGVIRAGHCAFPISHRNSAAAVADLLRKSKAKALLISSDKQTKNLVHAAQELLRLEDDEGPEPRVIEAPPFDAIYGQTWDDTHLPTLPDVKTIHRDSNALILHSSGSTSFPKPICLSHRNLVEWGLQPYFGEVDIGGRILSMHALPLFHAMGIISTCFALTTGVTLSTFEPSPSPQIPTADGVFESMRAASSHLLLCVPTFLEEWARDDAKVIELKKLDAIIFGGASVSQSTGDQLHDQGVKLFPFYGATELGGASQALLTKSPDAGWDYFKLSPHTSPELVQQEGDEHLFRLFFKVSAAHHPATLDVERDGIFLYDTKDILVRHPIEKDWWKIHGRADDQITHSTGEKTNPVPIEAIVNRHPDVASAVVFGNGRFQAGVLIEPRVEAAEGGQGKDGPPQGFVESIWPQIEEANQSCPTHSRIFKEMVLVSKPDKPFLYTAKGTPRRQVVINLYDREIDALYNARPEAHTTESTIANLGTLEGCIRLARGVVKEALALGGTSLRDTDDIFQCGCDSLQAIWIRNELSALLVQSGENTPYLKSPAANFVYAHPTIASLAAYMHDQIKPSSSGGSPTADASVAAMLALATKYSEAFQDHKTSGHKPLRECVLLTGSTGALGSYLLESLLLKPEISKVYVLNRPDTKSGVPSAERQRKAFREGGIDSAFLDLGKVVFLEGNLEMERCGVEPNVWEQMRTEVTCVMHLAWRVDFNVNLSSLEPLIRGTRRLVDFALSSLCNTAPKFVFASSIGVLRNYPERIAAESPIADPRVAAGSGYSESKWVAEQILHRAREHTSLRPVVVRFGQLCGGRNGYWNPSEWVPSIVRSGEAMGCLPRSPGLVSWLPVHSAASALTEIRNCSEPFLHFTHPAPIPWNDVIELLAEALSVPQVSYGEWLTQLEVLASDPLSTDIDRNPALKLLPFYQTVQGLSLSEDAEAFGYPSLLMEKATMLARSLHPPILQPLDRKDVASWVGHWKGVGFLKVPGFDVRQYTKGALGSRIGLRPYLSQGSRTSKTSGTQNGRTTGTLQSSSSTASADSVNGAVPGAALSSAILTSDQGPRPSLKSSFLLLISTVWIRIRIAFALPMRFLTRLRSRNRGH